MTTYPDYTIPANDEISLYSVFSASAGKELLLQNKTQTPVVIRTVSSTDNDGFQLVAPYSVTVSSTGDVFIKNIGYNSAVISVTDLS